jgi:predicted enzyme related to lactoylglutathione lyase
MGKRASHAPGTFSWVDLATTDVASAKSFYRALFGWELEDSESGGGAVYTICRLDGDAVCGIGEMPESTGSAETPPAWTSYVTVEDADAATERARELGGRSVAEPFDVLDAGRMAVIEDSRGGVFAIWQPRAAIGAERVNDVGCLCMNELVTGDLDAARTFYEGLFGWTTETVDLGPGAPSGFFHNRGRINASLFVAEGAAPPDWRACFTVGSTETALERVRELGGTVLAEPVDIGDGSLASALDPQGALFMVYAGEVDP